MNSESGVAAVQSNECRTSTKAIIKAIVLLIAFILLQFIFMPTNIVINVKFANV